MKSTVHHGSAGGYYTADLTPAEVETLRQRRLRGRPGARGAPRRRRPAEGGLSSWTHVRADARGLRGLRGGPSRHRGVPRDRPVGAGPRHLRLAHLGQRAGRGGRARGRVLGQHPRRRVRQRRDRLPLGDGAARRVRRRPGDDGLRRRSRDLGHPAPQPGRPRERDAGELQRGGPQPRLRLELGRLGREHGRLLAARDPHPAGLLPGGERQPVGDPALRREHLPLPVVLQPARRPGARPGPVRRRPLRQRGQLHADRVLGRL